MHPQGPVSVDAVQGAGVDSVQPPPDPGHGDGEPGAGLQPLRDPPGQGVLGAGVEPHLEVPHPRPSLHSEGSSCDSLYDSLVTAYLHSEGEPPHRAPDTAPVLLT